MLLALVTCHARLDLVGHVRYVTNRHAVILVKVPPTYTVPHSRSHSCFQSLETAKVRNWDSSRLNSSRYISFNDCNLFRNLGFFSSSMYLTVPCARLLQCSRSSRTSDFFRIDSAVIASFALLLEEKMLRRCPLHSLACQSTAYVSAAAAVATACCFHRVSTHVPLHSF